MASNRIKGITIEIGGNTTKLENSLKSVDKSLSNTQKQLKDVDKLLKLDPKNTELLRQKQELLAKAVEDTGERLTILKKALKDLENAGDSDKTIEQQEALKREIIATEEALKGYEKELKSSKLSLEKIGKASETVAKKTAKLSKAAAAVGAGLLANAVNSAKSADELKTLSKNTGISTKSLQKMQYASDLVDVSVEDMTGSLRKLTSKMGSDADLFDELGVSIKNVDGTTRDATDVWYDCLEALSKVGNETERDILAQKLFGKSASELSGIIDDGGESLKAYGQEAEEMGLIMSEDAVDAAAALSDQMDKTKNVISASFLQMGADLAESLLPMVENLVTWITKAVKWFTSMDGKTQTLILTIAGLVAAISPVATMISGITTSFGALGTAFELFTSPAGIVVAALAGIVAAGVLVYQNWDTIKEKASTIWENIKTTITTKFDAAKTTVTGAIDTIKTKLSGIVEGIKGIFDVSNWTLPKIKLPHFRVEGSFGWSWSGGLTLPKIYVDWYKKAMNSGYIFKNPTMIGVGDAGSETVVGTNNLLNMIRKASAEGAVNYGGVNVVINVDNEITGKRLLDEIENELASRTIRRKAVFG